MMHVIYTRRNPPIRQVVVSTTAVELFCKYSSITWADFRENELGLGLGLWIGIGLWIGLWIGLGLGIRMGLGLGSPAL